MVTVHNETVTALLMERQFLTRKADQAEYTCLFRDMQPGLNVYWNGFGDPPSLVFRAGFDDLAYNRERQLRRELVKGRFAGGNVGWVLQEDLELFAYAYRKPLDAPTDRQLMLLELIQTEGPLTIQQMKDATGLLVKEITPALHRLQEAFLVYEDQYDGEWDRGWYVFSEMFPDVDPGRLSKREALKTLLKRFAYRNVRIHAEMAKSFYRLPAKEIKAALEELAQEGALLQTEPGWFILAEDAPVLQASLPRPSPSVFALHRNDFLVKSHEYWLKEKFSHPEYDVLQYLLVDGAFSGALVGHFRFGPNDLEDVVGLPEETASARKAEILAAIAEVHGGRTPKRYMGTPL